MTDLDRTYGAEHRAEGRPPMPYFPGPSGGPAPSAPPAAPPSGPGSVLPPAAAQPPAEFASTGRRRATDPFAESYAGIPEPTYAPQPTYQPEQPPAESSYQPEPYQPEPTPPPPPVAPAPPEDSRSAVQGQIKIEDEVVEKIAALAALEVTGVAALGGQSRTSETMEAVRQRIGMTDRGEPRVRARILDNEISVDIALIVEYGSVVMDVARIVKTNVARIVGLMLGLRVATVNVTIEDVRMPDSQSPAS
ncbi:Asp23/Gls24 family envelope stress response protein [Actinocorallia sp. API 0066]|uniref:Asp23/Gls24 family envelope stress response protein n=1 Tax=Actinocorallia sp. API 0066 TaxID=2896846 RepID=UPI001E4DEDB7|nr:Asp23/Gls24 family envelope stress response protein [Actinocorallia sp. API 0066]MCD0448971.1 Asp23/Gls24 family envelope stress response protein [Actinocorallia sp. API 0066]